ncbi:hypothetical protein BGZ94_000491 [Podila epigama]|nr:hypothetical protein BGZ94_000491 [Podila epigama]
MDGVDCDWCLVCEKHTSNGAAYCSAECRSSDLISSSASSTSSTVSSDAYFAMTDANGQPLSILIDDNYPMPPFVRKQRTSIPNIYAHCASTPNPHPSPLMFTPMGNSPSALSHHLLLQKQQQLQQSQQQQTTALPPHPHSTATAAPVGHGQNPSSTPYPLFYATLNALRPSSPCISQDHSRHSS